MAIFVNQQPNGGCRHPGFATDADATVYHNQTAILTWLRVCGHQVIYARDRAVPSIHLPPVRTYIGAPCPYCGTSMTKRGKHQVTKDHKLPRSRGGILTAENRVIACRKCNSDKGGRTLEEWVQWMNNADIRVPLILRLIRASAPTGEKQESNLFSPMIPEPDCR